jgi:asparagine synthase (glutamine-hydrolysing)
MTNLFGVVRFDGRTVCRSDLERSARESIGATTPELESWTDGVAGLVSCGGCWAAVDTWAPLAADGGVAVLADARVGPDAGNRLFPEGSAPAILAAFRRWGRSWPRQVRGAFAAAIWEPEARRVTLTRDPIGERPLYWRRSGRELRFASEPVQLRDGASEPDRVRLLAYLLGAAPDPAATFFRNVHRLPEGHRLVVSPEGSTLERYWDWSAAAPTHLAEGEAAAALRERLERAVERRLPRTGGTGVLLSGGLDSSAVAAVAAVGLGSRGERVHAFTWSSASGDGIDERGISGLLIAASRNVVEHPVAADDLWPLSRFPEAYGDANDPEPNVYPDLLLTTVEAARDAGVATLMNGIGGDVVAGGVVPDRILWSERELGALARRLRSAQLRRCGLLRQILPRRRRFPGWLTPEAVSIAREAGLVRPAVPRSALRSRRCFRGHLLSSPFNARTLERFDRLSRRLGVRITAPWHDRDLFDWSLAAPDCALALRPPGKSLLREALSPLVPEAVRLASARKQAVHELRRHGLLVAGRGVVERLLESPRLEAIGLLRGSWLRSRYTEQADRREVMPGLWKIVTAESWLRTVARR